MPSYNSSYEVSGILFWQASDKYFYFVFLDVGNYRLRQWCPETLLNPLSIYFCLNVNINIEIIST